MRVIYQADDGSHFKLEEVGNGMIEVLFQDGITYAVAQATVSLKDYPNIAHTLYRNQQMAEAFRKGTPNSSAPNQRRAASQGA
jgi:hypothetical protein